jgi:ankyrin repeat protein
MKGIHLVERELLIFLDMLEKRKRLMRSVLHLAASSMTTISYSFFSTLLRNPNILVNLQDYESGQTALHRALYVGNIKAARDLLMRHDIDLAIKDIEGLTAFDLYNGTVEGVRSYLPR